MFGFLVDALHFCMIAPAVCLCVWCWLMFGFFLPFLRVLVDQLTPDIASILERV